MRLMPPVQGSRPRALRAASANPRLRNVSAPQLRVSVKAIKETEKTEVDPSTKEGEEQIVVVADSEAVPVKKNSTQQIALCVAGAAAVGGVIYAWKGPVAAQEYLAGYLLEQSLSVDNLFVFILCFNYFQTPVEYQERVLSWGIYSAAVLRLIMILAGVQLVENFQPLLLVFAGILIYSSAKIIFGSDKEEEEDLSENFVVKGINKVATVTETYRGDKFFVTENDIFKVTPLFVVLAVIEISDVVFAVDSIPAVFGVTLDPVIIYTSNMAAILSLRALYGFVATVIAELRYLDKAVAAVLAFIGAKMVLDQVAGYHISTTASLAVVATCLVAGTTASLLLPHPSEDEPVA